MNDTDHTPTAPHFAARLGRTLGVVVAFALMGCPGNPIETCPDAPDRDCCTENAQCLEFYGNDFPYCVGGNKSGGGVCSQCSRDDHCVGECEIVEDFGVCI